MSKPEECLFIPESEYNRLLAEIEKLKTKIKELEKRPIPLEENTRKLEE